MLQQDALAAEVMQLRAQGLPDNVILEELTRRGYGSVQIQQAVQQADVADQAEAPPAFTIPPERYSATAPSGGDASIYERVEEIAESLIDEKWDELLVEVRKIIDWKQGVEEKQTRLQGDVEKLKEDFKVLHQGVLGRLEEYDDRMRDVGTELKAVGKVFKDVIPQFVEKVKELKGITEQRKR